MSDNLQANIFISIRFETCASKEMESSTYSQLIHFLFIFPFFFVSAIFDFGLWDVELVYQKLKFYDDIHLV